MILNPYIYYEYDCTTNTTSHNYIEVYNSYIYYGYDYTTNNISHNHIKTYDPYIYLSMTLVLSST